MELILRTKQLEQLVEQLKKNYSKGKRETFIIDKNNSSNTFMVLIGGTPSSSYGASWMKEQVGDLLTDKNVMYSDWENTMEQNLQKLRESYPNANVSSVNGFSKGGLRAYPESGKYRFVGLIDPSIEGNYTSVDIKPNHNTLMIYQPGRKWGLKELRYAMEKLGKNRVVPVSKGHSEMPREFVSRFKSKL